jgi:hypothetical protein
MFGNTTACVTEARRLLEAAGYEVLVFAATGNGGRAMEALIASGLVAGVLDVTTTEWCDELVGGVLSAGPDRLGAAARAGIPQVVSVGALDMCNFGGIDTVPERFRDRNLYKHNPQVTLMRTTPTECAAIGQWIAARLNLMDGPVRFYLPEGGVSALDAPGQAFHDPAAREALFRAIEATFRTGPNRQLLRVRHHINDPASSERHNHANGPRWITGLRQGRRSKRASGQRKKITTLQHGVFPSFQSLKITRRRRAGNHRCQPLAEWQNGSARHPCPSRDARAWPARRASAPAPIPRFHAARAFQSPSGHPCTRKCR